ncbi:MAG: polysaccharide biosynthesis tyrosine autokinase, partial [Bacteroidota bacterium]
MQEQQNLPLETERRDPTADIRLLLWKLRQYWYWFVIGIALGGAAAYTYLRYTIPVYEATGTLLIKDEKNSSDLSDEIISSRLGLQTSRSLDNEIQIMRSKMMMEKIVEELDLEVSYIVEGRVINRSDYSRSFVEVTFHQFSESQRFEIKQLSSTQYQLLKGEQAWQCSFGDTCLLDQGLIAIKKIRDIDLAEENPLFISISSISSKAQQLAGQLNVRLLTAQGSILQASMEDPIPRKAIDVINKLFEIYERITLQEKTLSSENTLQFIDDRLDVLTEELKDVELGVERYRQDKKIPLNLEGNASQALGQSQLYQQQLSEIEIQLNVLETVRRYLTDAELAYRLLPANLGLNTEVLTPLITQHNDLVLQRERLLTSMTEDHPSVMLLTEQLNDQQPIMIATLNNLVRDLNLRKAQIDASFKKSNSQLRSIPQKERELLEISRQQQIKENLFLFLLQKREEVALSLAGTSASSRTLDLAYLKGQVSPNSSSIYLSAGLAGLLLSLSLVVLKELLSNKIETEDDIKRATSIPILGMLPKSKNQDKIVVKQGSRSAMNEMFRLLRTNLNFTKGKTFVVTSTISGEGKTYISINLGIALALSGKKTLLIGMDLRKPKMAKYLDVDTNQAGLTSYLIGEASAEEIIHSSDIHKNLFYINSGPVPPNPTELILDEKLEVLLNSCREQFDYILIDTSPVGLVTDALLLKDHVDSYITVVRQ